jgi:hypothetical protein
MLTAPRPTTLRRGALAAALLACALVPPTARAYVRTRSPDGRFALLWADPAITMTLRTSGPQVISAADFATAVRRAGATWSDPSLGTSIAFTIVGSGDVPGGTRFDQVNIISFRTDGWDPPMYPESALALTTVWSRDGTIVDADTEVNAVDPRFKWGLLPDDPALAAMASEVDLQNALTHELGHVIGLSHPCYLGDTPTRPEIDDQGAPVPSCADPDLPASVRMATMFPSSQSGSISARELSADEIRALHDLYPARPAPVAALGTRDGGCRFAPAPAHAGPTALLALVIGAGTVARRPRRRPGR